MVTHIEGGARETSIRLVLVYEVRDTRPETARCEAEELLQLVSILANGCAQNFSKWLSILAGAGLEQVARGLSVLRPHFMRYERRVDHHQVKHLSHMCWQIVWFIKVVKDEAWIATKRLPVKVEALAVRPSLFWQ